MAARLVGRYALSAYEAAIITASKALATYFEQLVALLGPAGAPAAAKWLLGELSALLNDRGVDCDASPVKAPQLALLIRRIQDGTVSGKIAKELFQMIARGDLAGYPDDAADILIERHNLKQVSDAGAIEKLVDEVIATNTRSVEEYKAGKEKALNALFGQVMKASNKTANPAQVTEMLKRKLAN
jgi:aspartyl-tRNA(Asn)/glutamyl-tRNA(Gln) amidotransferase subunit B